MVEIAADISRESCRYTRKLKGYARMLTVQLSDGVRVIHETARIAKQCDRFNLAGLPKMFDKHRIRLGHFFFQGITSNGGSRGTAGEIDISCLPHCRYRTQQRVVSFPETGVFVNTALLFHMRVQSGPTGP